LKTNEDYSLKIQLDNAEKVVSTWSEAQRCAFRVGKYADSKEEAKYIIERENEMNVHLSKQIEDSKENSRQKAIKRKNKVDLYNSRLKSGRAFVRGCEDSFYFFELSSHISCCYSTDCLLEGFTFAFRREDEEYCFRTVKGILGFKRSMAIDFVRQTVPIEVFKGAKLGLEPHETYIKEAASIALEKGILDGSVNAPNKLTELMHELYVLPLEKEQEKIAIKHFEEQTEFYTQLNSI